MIKKISLFVLMLFMVTLIPASAQSYNCAICKKRITGRWWTSDSNKNKRMCDYCARRAPENTCQVCRRSVLGEYRYWDTTYGRRFCKSCHNRYAKCCECYFPASDNNYPDPSVPTCNLCRKSIVVTQQKIDSLFGLVKEKVYKNFNINLPIESNQIKFRKVADMPKGENENASEYGTEHLAYYVPNSDRFEDSIIYVAPGMPEKLAYALLVHEYGHACEYYLNKDCGNFSGYLKEGFCEWLAYKSVLNPKDAKNFISRNKSQKGSFYREGFRMMLQLEKELGTNGVIEYIKTHTDFPRSYYK